MKMNRLVAIAVLAMSMNVGAAHAQIAEQQPAEFPPASYKGKQYVDSKGCVFIRAGIDGDVSWVPRVTRSRKTICGFTPSLGGQQVAAAAPRPQARKVEQITVDQAEAPKPAAAPAAAPAAKPRVVRQAARKKVVRQAAPKKVVRQTAPRKVVRRAAAKPVVRQVAPKPVAVAKAPAPVAKQRRAASRVATACPGASALSQQYLRGDGRNPVRCGPQAAPIVGFDRTTTRTASTTRRVATATLPQIAAPAPGVPQVSVTAQTRVVPKHVAINRINTQNVRIPRGYKRAWTDDRLNKKRAEQTLGGRQDMLLIWTNTVPRRLINQSNGRDVTASVPLVYPYLDVATQQRELGEVTIVQRDGQLLKRILRRPGAKKRVTRQPTYSTRSAPTAQVAPKPKARVAATPAKKPAVGGKRYVQIGYFTTSAKAQKAAQNLAGLGLRARIGKVRKGGKTYMAVQAGPFNSSSATQDALSRVRGFGYTGAVARN